MLVVKFDNIPYGEVADLVRCNNCESDAMLLPCGADICPFCGAVGCLEWDYKYFDEESNSAEVKVAEIEKEDEIDHVILANRSYKDLFSDED